MPELSIHVRTHHFAVRDITLRARPAVEEFARRFIQWGSARMPNGTYIKQPMRTYATATQDRREWRFHINQLNAFKDVLKRHYLTDDLVEIIHTPKYPPRLVELPIFEKWQPRDYQLPVLEFMNTTPPLPFPQNYTAAKLVSIQTGKGKASPLDSLVKIPGGWKKMGDVQVGDQVTAADGTPTQVTAIHPQGMKGIYRITFYDGRSAECCGNHLWKVYHSSSPSYWKVVNTLELIEMRKYRKDRHFVQLVTPEDGPEVELPIKPYTFGVLLGDGHFGETCVYLSTPDKFIVDEISSELDENSSITDTAHRGNECHHALVRKDKTKGRNFYVEQLSNMGLAGKLSHEKFIPEAYLHGSREQRLSLLQGLMDTDGTVNTSGTISYSTTSIELANAVVYLARSLGAIAQIARRNPSFTHNGEKKLGRQAYQVNMRHTVPSEFFRLPRKKGRVNDKNQYSPTMKLRIDNIEYIGEKEAQCITIAHPDHLYVMNDFIVTHNSFCGMNSMSHYGYAGWINIKPMYIDKWIEDVKKTFDIDDDDILVIQGSASLMQLLDDAVAGRVTAKVIITSNKTYQNYIKAYELFGDKLSEHGYAIPPDQFCEACGIGYRLVDEVHQDFHLNFKVDLYTHCPVSTSLSATLTTYDAFVESMYELAYPRVVRYDKMEYHKYVSARALIWSLQYPNKVRFKNGGNYSHNVFEQSILKYKGMTTNYLDLMKSTIDIDFIPDKREGDRLLVFCASIDMCTVVTDFLKLKYPHLDVRRYVEKDPYENAMEPDIIVSTMLSAGTALDIPNLRMVLMTTAMSSKQGNIQGLGRLRFIPDVKLRFVYLACENIPKQMVYHEEKKTLLKDRALYFRTDYYRTPV